jgi:hypothetical protein
MPEPAIEPPSIRGRDPLTYTVLAACFEATDDIWDDREAYIRAVLDVLGIDPDAHFMEGDRYVRAE